MVATLVRLRLKLFGRGVRGNTGKIVAMVVGGLYLLGIFVAIAIGLALLRSAPVALRGGATVVGFSVLTVAWPLITLLVAGSDQTLDPGRFALFPVTARQLLPGLLVVGLLSMGGVFTVGLALMHVVTWSTGVGTALAALLAGVLGCAICVLLARCATGLFSSALSSRRYRDSAAMVLALMGMTAGLAVNLVTHWVTNAGDLAHRAATVAGVAEWTPMGWAWSLPWDVARGQWWRLLLHLVLALALAAGLWVAWGRALAKALVSPLENGGGGGHVKSSSLVERLVPRTPAGAVAARSLRYWRRDPRHLVQLAAVVLMPVLILVPQLTARQTGPEPLSGAGVLWIPVMSTLMMGCLVVAQEISYDGSALWMHISAGLRGRDDRLGRLISSGLLLLPLSALSLLVFVTFTHTWRLAPAVLGCGVGGLLVSGAVGSVTGAMWQVPQPPPGSGAFSRSSGGGVAGLLLSFVTLIATAVLSAPIVLPVLLLHNPAVAWVVLFAGPAYGLLLVWLALRWAGGILDRTWPEVLAAVDSKRA